MFLAPHPAINGLSFRRRCQHSDRGNFSGCLISATGEALLSADMRLRISGLRRPRAADGASLPAANNERDGLI